jgi:hypothetical protein
MPLKATLQTEEFETLNDDLKSEYEKTDDGTYRLAILSGYTSNDKVEDVSGLKSALQKERENAKSASHKLRELQEQFGDIDPEEYSQLKNQAVQAEEERARKAGEWDKLKQQQNEIHQREIGKWKDREKQLISAIENAMVDSEVVSALNEAGGQVKLLLPHAKGRMKLVEEDGKFFARVLDETGTVRVNGEGGFLSAKELISEMRDNDVYAPAFEAGVRSGGGTPPAGGGGQGDGKKGGTPSDLKRSKMTVREKVDFVKEHGDDAYQSLPL